jgi:hypothetical protein
MFQDFVVERWCEVQGSEEFERGCAEVAAGECVEFRPTLKMCSHDPGLDGE